jgi:hypothetical protein
VRGVVPRYVLQHACPVDHYLFVYSRHTQETRVKLITTKALAFQHAHWQYVPEKTDKNLLLIFYQIYTTTAAGPGSGIGQHLKRIKVGFTNGQIYMLLVEDG